MELWTAFMIGIMGSMHCVGMCGPIALALPYQGSSSVQTLTHVMTYHLGRTATYALIGGLFGLLGQGIFLAGYQSALSIGIGLLLLFVALFSIQVERGLLALPWIHWLKDRLGRVLRIESNPSFLAIGLLNGLLPCGLVYMAAAGALSTGSLPGGMLYMALFGLGTIPLMLSLSLAGSWIGHSFRSFLRRLFPFFLFAFALLFIFRGMQFQLPFDFFLWESAQQSPMCH